MPRTAAARAPSDQIDFLLDDLETLRAVHGSELKRMRAEAEKLRQENESLRLVIASQHSALSACRGLPMTPPQRDRLAGAIKATAQVLGIRRVE